MELKPYIKTRYRVMPSKRSDANHWLGGEPYHRNANCPVCKRPLLLLWDINCKDPRFRRGTFGSLTRLPLYYCWCCVNDISYLGLSEDKIRIHPAKRSKDSFFQYEPYPTSFERRPISFYEGVPDEIRELVAKVNDDDFQPSAHQKKVLREFFGHPITFGFGPTVVHHQLGGRPINHSWAEEVFECSNPECSGKLADRLRGKKRAMRFLAGILNDRWGGLPMVEPAGDETKQSWNFFVSAQFHICDVCFTVTGANRCT